MTTTNSGASGQKNTTRFYAEGPQQYSDTVSAPGTSLHVPHSVEGSSNSAHEAETMRVPESLRWAVTKMVEMVDAGWEPCGFTGGFATGERRQFVRVEFRRAVSDAD